MENIETTDSKMNDVLELQKDYFIKNGPPSLELRIDRLNRLKNLILSNKTDIIKSLNDDFGNRSDNASLLSDIYMIIQSIGYASKNLKHWIKPEKRSSNFPFNLFGAKSYVQYEPLGTVGMISPWNFPVNLSLNPLVAIFAAGNQAMHKPSEITPNTAALIKKLCDENYDEHELATFLGGPDIGEEFSNLKFDHLLYTGSSNVGRHVMKAASNNLVPVTLELGGKSPVIIGNTADIKTSAKRIMFGKTLNAGQICLAPDYVIVQKQVKDDFIAEAKNAVTEFFPDIKNNNDYTSIINQKHYDRINELVEDAKEKGAEVIEINPANEDFTQQEFYKIPPTLIANANNSMNIMHEEIFGPVLPVVSYDELDEALELINSKEKPLGLYYFGKDNKEQTNVLSKTSSGGVTINNVVGHLQQMDLPFGGVGNSGTGRYQSHDGFKNFSNARAVFKDVNSRWDKLLLGAIRPPYKHSIEKILKALMK